jgi:hypothetical protein
MTTIWLSGNHRPVKNFFCPDPVWGLILFWEGFFDLFQMGLKFGEQIGDETDSLFGEAGIGFGNHVLAKVYIAFALIFLHRKQEVISGIQLHPGDFSVFFFHGSPLLFFENGMAFRSLVLFSALPLCQEKKGGIPTFSRPYKILIILDIN